MYKSSGVLRLIVLAVVLLFAFAFITFGFADSRSPIASGNSDATTSPAQIRPQGDGIITYYALLLGSGAFADDRNLFFELFVNNDVSKMVSALTTHGGNWSADHITRMTNADLSSDAITAAITNIGQQMDNDDFFLFYYSGHGDNNPGSLLLFNRDLYYELIQTI